MYLYYSLSGLFIAITSTLFAILVYRGNRNSKINKYFALLAVAFALWAYPYAMWPISDTRESVTFWFRVLHFGAIYIPIAYFHLVLVWSNQEKKQRILLVAGYILALFFASMVFTPWFIAGMEQKFAMKWWAIPGKIYYYYLAYFFFYYIYSSVLLFLEYLKSTGIRKKQIRLVLIGLVVSIASGSTNYFLWFNINIPPYGNILASSHIILGTYAIVRYKFLSIKIFFAQVLMLALNLIAFIYIFISETPGEYVIKTLFFLGIAFVSYLLKKSFDQEIKQKQELQRLSKKLARANRKLKQLDQAKSEFISIASHQLRTPLGAVKGFASLLLEGSYGEISEKVKEVLKKISISNERLISLVSDLLDLSRIEAGKMRYDFDYWQIENIVKEIKETLSLKAEEKGLYLKVNFSTRPLPKIKMDGVKIREVISNLVENAVKYTKRGGVEVNFKQKDNLIKIIVSDTGIGISQDEMPLLFSKFSRGKNVGRIDANGTGLGLFVGRKIIEAHGGRIWAESKGENKGSRFIIELLIDGVGKSP